MERELSVAIFSVAEANPFHEIFCGVAYKNTSEDSGEIDKNISAVDAAVISLVTPLL